MENQVNTEEKLQSLIQSILMWAEDLDIENNENYNNGYKRDYKAIYSLISVIAERSKEAKGLMREISDNPLQNYLIFQ